MPDLNHIRNLHHSSLQHRILNPLSEARDQTCVLIITSQIHFHWVTTGTPISTIFRAHLTSAWIPSAMEESYHFQSFPAYTLFLSGEIQGNDYYWEEDHQTFKNYLVFVTYRKIEKIIWKTPPHPHWKNIKIHCFCLRSTLKEEDVTKTFEAPFLSFPHQILLPPFPQGSCVWLLIPFNSNFKSLPRDLLFQSTLLADEQSKTRRT